MSAMREAIEAIKGTLLLTDKVRRVGESLGKLAEDVANHEKRLIRLEAKWETAIEIASISRSKEIGN
jgi:hypothetical protein